MLRKWIKKIKNEVAGSAKTKSTTQTGAQKRTEPRIYFAKGQMQFRSSSDVAYDVLNLSASGISFYVTDTTSLLKRNDLVKGMVAFGGSEFSLECNVLHFSSQLVGCKITNENQQYANTLESTFVTELKAHRLVKVDPKHLARDENTVPYYYYGSNREELFFSVDKKTDQISKFVLIFDGNYFEWASGHVLKIGQQKMELKERSQDAGSLNPINFLKQPDKELLGRAQAFIENIDWLDLEYKSKLKQILASRSE